MLLQYALAAWAIPLAHAVLVDGHRMPAAHVESQGNRTCIPTHNEVQCPVSGVARLLAAPPKPVSFYRGGTSAESLRHLELLGRPLPAAVNSLGSRAPPLV